MLSASVRLILSKVDLEKQRRLGVSWGKWRAWVTAAERDARDEATRRKVLARMTIAAAARARRSRADALARALRLWARQVQEIVKQQGIEVSR